MLSVAGSGGGGGDLTAAADRRAAAARQWGIAVVDLRWLAACVEAGGFLPIDVDGQQGPAGCGGQPGETESPAGKVAPSVVARRAVSVVDTGSIVW